MLGVIPYQGGPVPACHYIAIEGVIGVGKTTLARLMRPAFEAQLLLEVFEENPFLGDFYADRDAHAFQTQIFFLLSRYRQQHRVIQQLLHQGTVISDYTFSKDRLFAHLNLSNDELDTYEHLHQVMAESVLVPDLVVYLQANTATLMERIAVRDRPYERSMSRAYIEDLGEAYRAFFADYAEAPVLTIDSDDLDIVRRPEDLADVVQRVRNALGYGTHQPELPAFEPEASVPDLATAVARRRLTDLQQWHRAVDPHVGPDHSPYYQLLRLQESVGGLAQGVAKTWMTQDALTEKHGNREEALVNAADQHRQALESTAVDCLAWILRVANRLGIDLESAYIDHMKKSERDTGEQA